MTQAQPTPSPLSVQAFFDASTNTVTYLLVDPETRAAAIIDPVLDFDPKSARLSTTSADRLLAAIADQGLTLHWILETHAHADHLSAAHHLRAMTGARIVIGEHIKEVQKGFGDLFEADDVTPDGGAFDLLVAEGDVIALGSRQIRVMHTPGHTPACVSYLVDDTLFVGDTLFMPDYGTARADFPGGDAATLYRSIRKILALPSRTRILVGHDYLPAGRETYAWETTVGEQRAANIHVHDGVDEADFVTLRETRDATLSAPTLILQALQVNIRAGALPPASPSGRVFLKLPINAL
ncbi:MBL fold metallo-hydrolase [Caulobacter sp. ErkDOM-YI]|uniref:MBL fold metallo-hydrolase n=1 Tax=unclassified Caulobacter TaxID=2648921 RepID=UPI003AF66CF7